MAAAAYKATLVFVDAQGNRFSRYCTADDVNGNYYTFQDGNTFITFSSDTRWIDLTLSAAGTDTTNSAVYQNGAPTSLQIINSANVYNVLDRQIKQVQPLIKAGTTLKIKQAT